MGYWTGPGAEAAGGAAPKGAEGVRPFIRNSRYSWRRIDKDRDRDKDKSRDRSSKSEEVKSDEEDLMETLGNQKISLISLSESISSSFSYF